MGLFRRDTAGRVRLAWLLVGLLALSTAAVSPGCSSKTSKEAREELKKLKQKKKPKDPFDRLQVITEPAETTFVERKPPKIDPDTGEEIKETITDEEENQLLPRGHIKPGHWTGVLVTTTANNFDFSGELAATARDSSQQPIELEGSAYRLMTTRPAALPKGQRKTLETIFFAPPVEERISTWMHGQLRSRQSGAEEWSHDELFRHMPSYQYYMYVLARDATRYRYFKVLDSVRPPLAYPTVIAEDQDYYRLLTPKPTAPLALPTRALAWTSIAYVVWDDVLPNTLMPEQQQALIDWLHWGGGLIVSGPRTLDAMRGTFLEPYLPALAAETTKIDEQALAELNEHWTVPSLDGRDVHLTPAEPWSGVTLEKHPLAEFVPGTGRLVAARRVGRGRVVVTAFRLSERELVNWPSVDSFVNGCLFDRLPRRFNGAIRAFEFVHRDRRAVRDSFDARHVTAVRYFTRDTNDPATERYVPTPVPDAQPADPNAAAPSPDPFADWQALDRLEKAKAQPGVAAWNDFSWVAGVARETLREAAGISVPNRRFVLWMVGIYLLIVVPVNWAVFRVAGRVEWAWLAVPVLAIAWGLVVVWLAQLDIGFARAETEVAVLEVQAGYSRAHLTRYTALYSSLSTTYDVHFDDASALAQPLALDRNARIGEGRPTVALRSLGDVQLADFVVSSNSTGMVHSEQMISLNGTLDWQDGAEGAATLSNNTRVPLTGVCLVRRRVVNPDADYGTPLQTVSEAAWIGELPPGGSAAVEFRPRDEAMREIAEGRETSPVTARKRPEGTLSLRRLMSVAQSDELLEPGDVRLVGWYDRGVPGVSTAPAAPQARRATLVVANLEFGHRPPRPDENRRDATNPFDE